MSINDPNRFVHDEQGQTRQITHPEMVAALAKPGADIMAGLSPSGADLWHHATGVVTEAGELLAFHSRANMVEELGDFEFYLTGVYLNLGIERIEPTLITLDGVDLHTELVELAFHSTELLDAAKKVAVYGQVPDVSRIGTVLLMIERCLTRIRFVENIDRDYTLRANMTKLARRYPGFVYSDAAAKARADKA